MLEKPNLADEQIIACLRDDFALGVSEITFLPLGADFNSAAYHAITNKGQEYFIKLRRGDIPEIAVSVPKFLNARGIRQVVAPLATKHSTLSARVNDYSLILYPFIHGQNGFHAALSETRWNELGRALKQIHTVRLPHEIEQQIPRETFSSRWRDALATFLQVKARDHDDSAAQDLTTILCHNRAVLERIILRGQELANEMKAGARNFVLCHTDIHGGNVLLTADDQIHVVDWDNPMMSPRERDLMFVQGAGASSWYIGGNAGWFTEGYGENDFDLVALAYYRNERTIEDIVVTCEEIFSTSAGGENRAEAVRFVAEAFMPNKAVEIAKDTYNRLGFSRN